MTIPAMPSVNAVKKPPFMAFVSDEASRQNLLAFASHHKWTDSAVKQGDIATATEYLRLNPTPQVLLVELPSSETAAQALDKLADVCDPNVKVITVGDINEYSFYCWLMEIGIVSYLLKPLAPEALEQAYGKTQQARGAAAGAVNEAGKIIAVIGTRGGVGASTLAVNLAAIIAHDSKMRTALVDMDPQLGTASLMLDLEPGRGFKDALEKPDRIDHLFIERVMTRVTEELYILSTEEGLEEPVHYHEQAADRLLAEVQKKFAYAVIDLPRSLNAMVRQVLKKADHIVLVSELTLSGLRDAARLLEMLKDKMQAPGLPLLVANRVGIAGKFEMLKKDFEKGLGGDNRLAHLIPFSQEVMGASTLGQVLADINKKMPAMEIMRAIAHSLMPEEAGGAPPPAAAHKPKLLSLFQRKK